MASSSKSTDVAQEMLRDLHAVEALAASLEATAPCSIKAAGGAHALIAAHGRRTGAWFWSITPLSEALWERMAEEHQARHRACLGE